ncbi:MAG: D-alanine--D-alanine ligase [Chloroflexi bacterium]|nr:D-alanine--D-alanine ligase [Chloroflexota bacterium]
MANYRIGVIFGGRSTEHEVSVVTGLQVISFLERRHEVIPIYITKEGRWLTGKNLSRLETFKAFNPKDPELETLAFTPDTGLQAIRNPLPKGILDKPKKLELDVVFPAMHGMHGEDGTLQGLLELVDLPYVGSGVTASAICMDKVLTKVVLKGYGLPVLESHDFTRTQWEEDEAGVIEQIESKFSYPMIVKPVHLGSSIAVEVAHDQNDLKFHISVASHFDAQILVEPYIKQKVDINCSVLGNENPVASVCEQPVSKDQLLSFADKYLHDQRERGMEGATRLIPAPIGADLTVRIQQMAIEAFRRVGAAGIARVDFLLDGSTNQVYVNEINTLPGSFAYYLWEPAGISPEELADRLIDLAMQAHREKSKTNFASGPLLLQNVDLIGLKK